MNRILTIAGKSRAWVFEILGKLFLPLLILMMVGCVFNEPWRTGNSAQPCDGDSCGTTLIEEHEDPQYALAFVEFTERGNVFDRKKLETVLSYVDDRIKEDNGVTVIVFVHGWKNNASTSNDNVNSFRQLLKTTALRGKQGGLSKNRKVVGVYIGWRGQSLNVEYLNSVTYWDRKAVAEEVGKGGVTELLLRLEHMIMIKNPENDPNRNLYLVTGHSFGGAVVLSSLHEVMLERVVAAGETENGCFKTRPFGHGVVLLNPAIEANEMLQLKELVAQKCFVPSQDRLMHVISSDADIATNWAFRVGQWFGVNLSWSQTELDRELGERSKKLKLDERDLDTITVGNFSSFRTGWMTGLEQLSSNEHYFTCIESDKCVNRDDPDEQLNHIPVKYNEPLAFIFSNSTFIEGHNDVFNPKVQAYIATIVTEARAKRILALGKNPKSDLKTKDEQYYIWYEDNRKEMVRDGIFKDCLLENTTVDGENAVTKEKAKTGDPFDFGMCFDRYREAFKADIIKSKGAR